MATKPDQHKILYVIDRLNEGAGRVVYDLVRFIDRSRFAVEIAAIYRQGNLLEDFSDCAVKIFYLDKKPGKDLGLIARLRDLIRRGRYTIVHTHNVDGYEYGVAAAFWAGARRIIHTAHGKSIKASPWRRRQESLYHRLLARCLSDYIVVSNDLGVYVAGNWCRNRRKIRTIYNGVDTAAYAPLVPPSCTLAGLELPQPVKLLGIVAGLRPVKDHATLLQAMQALKPRWPECRLLVIGDGPERSALERMRTELGLADEVFFLGNRRDVAQLFNCLDVGVLCSRSECLSMTLLEGMACQVPFVATEVGGNPELIRNRSNGLLVAPAKPRQLATAISELFSVPQLREQLGHNARATVVKSFTTHQMIAAYQRLYSGLFT